MPDGDAELHLVIGSLYEAAYDPLLWPQAWAAAVRAFDGQTGLLTIGSLEEVAEAPRLVAMPGFSLHALTLYGQHYAAQDPYAAHGRRHLGQGPHLGQEILSPDAFRNTEIWYDFSRTHLGAFHVVGEVVPLGGGQVTMAGMHRPEDAPPFEERDRRRAGLLFGHLKRALQVSSRLDTERKSHDLLAGVLDGLKDGAVVTDARGAVLYANKVAEGMVGPAAGIVMASRSLGLQVLDTAGNATLARLIAGAAKGAAGGQLLISGVGLRPTLMALVTPLPRSQAETAVSQGCVLILLRKIVERSPMSEVLLRKRFDLSAAEAQVARILVEGASVEAVAQARQVSVNTIRSQIRHILSKTGCQDIRALTRLLLSGAV